jgi:hypothetical protein
VQEDVDHEWEEGGDGGSEVSQIRERSELWVNDELVE